MYDLPVLPQPEQWPGGGDGVEVGGTRHHVAHRDQDASWGCDVITRGGE